MKITVMNFLIGFHIHLYMIYQYLETGVFAHSLGSFHISSPEGYCECREIICSNPFGMLYLLDIRYLFDGRNPDKGK